MLLNLLSPLSRTLISNSRIILSGRRINPQMGGENLSLIQKKKHANFRLINVSGFKTDLLEIQSEEPTLHVLFIPGNPGVISFYTDFLESLYGLLGGTASVTAIGHISHSDKNWESGRLFSLQEQIDHKISFMEKELQDVEVPIVLVNLYFTIFALQQEKFHVTLYSYYPFHKCRFFEHIFVHFMKYVLFLVAFRAIIAMLVEAGCKMGGSGWTYLFSYLLFYSFSWRDGGAGTCDCPIVLG